MTGPLTFTGNGLTATIADPENITRDECLALALCGADAWNSWRREFPSKFYQSSLHFGANISTEKANFANFSDCVFDRELSFSNFKFGDGAEFDRAKFVSVEPLNDTEFGCGCSFRFCEFHSPVIFSRCGFYGETDFACSKFKGTVVFSSTKFDRLLRFDGAEFDGPLVFESCDFPQRLCFSETEFRGVPLSLKNVTKLGEISIWKNADFSGAYFSGVAEFTNIRFVGSTKFSRSNFWSKSSGAQGAGLLRLRELEKVSQERPARFSQPPWFFNTTFEQDVTFAEAEFPLATGFEKSSRAYRVLKQAFSEQQATREEKRFFKLEMQEEAAAESGWKRWLYRAYEVTSDFGFSVWRPLVTLVVLPALVAMLLYLLCMCIQHPELWTSGLAQDSKLTSEWLQFTLANMAPLPDGELLKDLRTNLFGSNTYAAVIALKLETLQKVLALAGYFLFGLAPRNLFKMK